MNPSPFIKRVVCLILLSSFLFFNAGCALLRLAATAATLYGIYEAIEDK